jgi:hypothetical protein
LIKGTITYREYQIIQKPVKIRIAYSRKRRSLLSAEAACTGSAETEDFL